MSLRFGQKVRILVFLCLSVFMIAFALARLFGGLYRDSFGVLTLSVTWTHTWLHFESSVAVLMGGITAFRTVFAGQVREAGKRHTSSSTIYKRIRSIFRRTPSETDSGVVEKLNKNRGFLAGPQTGASIKGMPTFIRRIGREPINTTMEDSVMDSQYDPLESYHAFRRDADANVPRAGSNDDSFKNSADIDVSIILRPVIRALLT
ncbi:hypothetical protein SLS60_003607 [Paraconiothyrium brasiliense]|uniref:Uncharacterized protein n=1 Tax=Paraconiothyrium brasiliense TaxID=300254 RepID=A0ABR3RP48_9PLEO